MARKNAAAGKPKSAAPGAKLVKGVRLDLSPADHKRLERIARERGLTMASYARMVLLERLKADDKGEG
jgi:hypothetical protein